MKWNDGRRSAGLRPEGNSVVIRKLAQLGLVFRRQGLEDAQDQNIVQRNA